MTLAPRALRSGVRLPATAALALLVLGSLGGAVSAASASVTIRDLAFQPSTVTVRVGDTVTWTNADDVVHTVRWASGQESRELARGESYSRTFSQAGSYGYICGPHPFMTGTVRVLASGSGAGSGSGGGAQPGTDTAESTPGGLSVSALALPALLALLGAAGLLAVRLRRGA